MDPEAVLGTTPRSASRLMLGTLGLYRRYPLIFLVLAGSVIVPYYVVVLLATGEGPFSEAGLSAEVGLLLTLLTWCLITPLISALHIHAVADVREGRDPRLGEVARKGLAVLPVVVAASIISGLGTAAGFFALIIPGIYLSLRWAVVAQAAAIEQEGWLPALRSSGRLLDGHYGHVFVFLLFVFAVLAAPTFLVALVVGEDVNAGTFILGVALEVVISSFGALATALLYFDLRTRREVAPAPVEATPPTESFPDSRLYSDESRPKGWYVNPDEPDRMRFWGGEAAGWQGSTPTPRQIRQEWDQKGDERE